MPSRLPGTEAARVEANLKKALGRDLTPEESRLLGLTISVLPAEDPETDSPGNSQRRKKLEGMHQATQSCGFFIEP